MLVRAQVRITDDSVVTDHQTLLREFPARATQTVNRTVKRVRNRVTQRFKKVPRRPSFPYGQFPWASRKQQQAFHASNGFGRGIPTRRTGDFVRAWKLVVLPQDSGIPGIGVYNPTFYRKFVTGRFQQPFHVNRWYREADLFREANRELHTEVKADLLALFDEVTKP